LFDSQASSPDAQYLFEQVHRAPANLPKAISVYYVNNNRDCPC